MIIAVAENLKIIINIKKFIKGKYYKCCELNKNNNVNIFLLIGNNCFRKFKYI